MKNVEQRKQLKLQDLETKKTLLDQVQKRALENLQLVNQLELECAPQTYDIGKDLEMIVANKLYKVAEDADGNNYKSFKKYADDFLGISDKYAYMLINAAKVQDLLSKESAAPKYISEKLLRKLVSSLKYPEKVVKIWKCATENNNTIQPSEKKLNEAIAAEKRFSEEGNSKPSTSEKLNAKTFTCNDCIDILRELSSGKSTLSDAEIKKFKQKIAKFIDLHNKKSK